MLHHHLATCKIEKKDTKNFYHLININNPSMHTCLKYDKYHMLKR